MQKQTAKAARQRRKTGSDPGFPLLCFLSPVPAALAGKLTFTTTIPD